MQITLCTQEDFQQIFRQFNSFWTPADEARLNRLKILHHPACLYEFGDTAFVIKSNGSIRAYLFGFYSQKEPLAYVHAVAVHQDHRRAGLASRLYEHFIQQAKTQGCRILKAITTPTNHDSINFHKRLGMEAKVIADYSGPGEDRVVFTKTI